MMTPVTVLGSASADSRALWSIVVLLAVVGVALAMLAVWLVRATRPDRELLGPLEVMGQRKWRRSDPVWQRRQLDSARPTDAEPLAPARSLPEPDESFDAGPQASGFEDLGELASAAAAGGDAEVDRDATPPSMELPVVVAVPESPEPPVAPAAVDVPLTLLAALPEAGNGRHPEDREATFAEPPSGLPAEDLSPPHGLAQRPEREPR